MRRAAEFSPKTRELVAKRCQYRCSNPDCRKPTIGAHSERDKYTSIGKVAHIEAASPGGPRYNTKMTIGERKNISNAIWLCSSCADMIDKDTVMYTVVVLHKWKNEAEQILSEALQVHPPRVFAIANPAGGVAKSFATALLSYALSCETKERVLSVNTNDNHVAVTLGYEFGQLKELKKEMSLRYNENLELSILESPIGIDTILGEEIERLHHYSTLENIFRRLSEDYRYKYCLCDCGRGIDYPSQRHILSIATDIIIPVGQHVWAFSGTFSLIEIIKHNKQSQRVWFLFSIGFLKAGDSLNARLFREFQESIDEFNSLQNISCKSLKTIVPYNAKVRWASFYNKSLYSWSKTKNVVEAYKSIALELVVDKL